MKILVSLTYYLPYISGLSIYAQRLSESLVGKGHQLTVLTSRYNQTLPEGEIINNVKVNRIWSPIKLHKGIIMPTWPIVSRKAVIENDVVICHLPQIEGLWVLFWSKIYKRKTICVYHCDVNLPSSWFNRFVVGILMGVNHLCLTLTDAVVNSSKDYATHSPLLKHYLHKLTIIYPPIIISTKKTTNKHLPTLFYKKKTKIGFVGRMAAEKGIEYLLETIPLLQEKLPSFGIYIVGPQDPVGEREYVLKIKKLINQYCDNVEVLGKLSDDQLNEFYRNIDLLVLPSVNSTEAFGMVQTEAMLYGKPVVVSDMPGVREAVNVSGMGLLTEPKNSRSLADKIMIVLTDPNSYTKNIELAQRQFSIGKTSSDFVNLIKTLGRPKK